MSPFPLFSYYLLINPSTWKPLITVATSKCVNQMNLGKCYQIKQDQSHVNFALFAYR